MVSEKDSKDGMKNRNPYKKPHFKQRPRFAPQERPSLVALDQKLKKSGISLEKSKLEQLWAYHNLLRERNQDRDLTRLIGFDTIVTKHYIDCMIVGDIYKLPSPIADIGTGAGFPGIPLKIRYPHLQMILAEPRPRRIEFLKESCRLLKFKNVEVFEHKVVSQSFTQNVNAVISRALEEIPKTLLRTSGCARAGTKIIFMKGPNADAELKEAQRTFPGQFEIELDHAYHLPMTSHERRLIVLSLNQTISRKRNDSHESDNEL
jgi:16S rRNA (guanine527-N7)-methyltransferase